MALNIFRNSDTLNILKSNIEENIDLYRSGDFNEVLKDTPLTTIVGSDEFNRNDFDSLVISKDAKYDYENSVKIWEILSFINPRIARDHRIWTYLTHTYALEYTRARWVLTGNNEEDYGQILRHSFIDKDKRGFERDNAISRLWMNAYVSSKVNDIEMKEALQILLIHTDFREHLIGRPVLMKSNKILTSVIKTAKRIKDSGDLDFFKKKSTGGYYNWFLNVNILGGTKLLDALSEDDLDMEIEKASDAEMFK